jgi:predicted DNA-binding protein (MmcQ/YjbR family)
MEIRDRHLHSRLTIGSSRSTWMDGAPGATQALHPVITRPLMSETAHPPPPPVEQRHPLSNRVRDIALALPDTFEDHPWGDIVFKVGKKMFASTAARSGYVCVKANPAELEGLLRMPGVSLAPYVGRFGWIVFEFDSEDRLPFVEGLVQASYELIKGKAKKKAKRE